MLLVFLHLQNLLFLLHQLLLNNKNIHRRLRTVIEEQINLSLINSFDQSFDFFDGEKLLLSNRIE